MTTTQIPLQSKNKSSKFRDVDFTRLEFGKHVSDNMISSSFDNGQWSPPQLLPYGDLTMSPSTLALHYGQTVFEGMKAFRMHDNRISIFRVEKHYQRFARSLERMCMAIPARELFTDSLTELVAKDADWVPHVPGASLYLRPFIYASEERFGVKISDSFRFIIFTGPVPELYTSPIKVRVEMAYSRAAKGGTGFAKCGGNYGGSYFPTRSARAAGYEQVLWTDSRENKFIEESGMMNVMFVIDNKLVTPSLTDSILDGVTRDSLLIIARDMWLEVQERPVSVEELEHAFRNRSITEAFGAGTAAVVAPISVININDTDYHLPEYSIDSKSSLLKRKLDNIRLGIEEDKYGWNTVID